MSPTRILEVGAWIAGALLLTTYAGVRTWSARSSDEGIDAMRQARLEHAAQLAQNVTAEPSFDTVRHNSLTAAQPDTSTWAPKRLAEYKESLALKAMPQGVLRIPTLKLEVPIYEGTGDLTLNRGAGRITGTASVDSDSGNIGIAAHRDGFFRPLKDIKVGDVVFLDTVTATKQFRVTKLTIVDPSDVGVLAQTPAATMTLVTCYPFYYVGSAPRRFIVHAQEDQGTTE